MNTLYHAAAAVLALFLFALPLRSQGQAPPGEAAAVSSPSTQPAKKAVITFTPGVRMQTRYEYDAQEKNHDFYITRLRLKGRGEIFELGIYAFEIKIDNEGRFNRVPRAQLENAWMSFPIRKNLNLCAGLFDGVFSRNAVTLDSRLLLMDRTLMKDALTVLGLADNTIGVLLHGRPLGRHLSYGVGIFDNVGFETLGAEPNTVARRANGAMTTSRVAVDLLDPAGPVMAPGFSDYMSSYIGQGKRLTLGGNIAYLSQAEIGEDVFSLFAWGGDLFFNKGPFTAEAEYSLYREHFTRAGDNGQREPDFSGSGWSVQSGYLFLPKFELAIRYQELDASNLIAADRLMWTSVGMNIYIRNHNFKVQTEYTFKREEKVQIDNNQFRVQVQIDF